MSDRKKAVSEKFQAGWIHSLDRRTGVAQMMVERFEALTSDLGGAGQLSYQERSLCERALWIEYWLIEEEKQLAMGGDFNVNKWAAASNTLQGIYSKLGLKRVARDVPTLNEYMARKAQQ